MATPKIKVNSAKKIARTEIGDTAGIVLNGIVRNAEYNNDLKGTSRVKIYDQMRLGDATVQAALRVVKLPILGTKWRVEPASDRRQDKKIAEFVESELMDMPTRTWSEMLSNILLFLDYGVMPFEIVWEFREEHDYGFGYPLIGLRKLAPRFPDTIMHWKLPNGEDGIVQSTDKGMFNIPMEKMIIFVNQKEGDNWEGISLLRSAYKSWYMKEKYYLIDAMATERQGLGIPTAEAPTGATPQDEAKIDEILSNLRANEKGYLRYPAGWKVGLMDMKGSTLKNALPMIQHHDRQIVKNVLAQFLELGAGGSSGSWALSKDQSKLFILSLDYIAEYAKDTLERYLVKKMVDYNFDVEDYPTLEYETIGEVDLNNYTTALQRALQTGALLPDGAMQRHVRGLFDLPEADGEIADPSMVEDLLLDEGSMFRETPDFTPNGDMEEGVPTDEDIAEAMETMQTMTASDIVAEYGTDVAKLYAAGLSEETRKKISEALKNWWSSRKKLKTSGGKGKGRKAKNPEVTKRNEQAKKLRKELRNFNDGVQREFLEMKAKGIQLSDEELAKKRLEIFDKRKALKDRIDKLMDEIDDIKDQDSAKKLEEDREEVTASDGMLQVAHELSRLVENVEKSIEHTK